MRGFSHILHWRPTQGNFDSHRRIQVLVMVQELVLALVLALVQALVPVLARKCSHRNSSDSSPAYMRGFSHILHWRPTQGNFDSHRRIQVLVMVQEWAEVASVSAPDLRSLRTGQAASLGSR